MNVLLVTVKAPPEASHHCVAGIHATQSDGKSVPWCPLTLPVTRYISAGLPLQQSLPHHPAVVFLFKLTRREAPSRIGGCSYHLI